MSSPSIDRVRRFSLRSQIRGSGWKDLSDLVKCVGIADVIGESLG